jgi:hypothetical protein
MREDDEWVPVEPESEDDFGASLSPELRAQEEYLRAQVATGHR